MTFMSVGSPQIVHEQRRVVLEGIKDCIQHGRLHGSQVKITAQPLDRPPESCPSYQSSFRDVA